MTRPKHIHLLLAILAIGSLAWCIGVGSGSDTASGDVQFNAALAALSDDQLGLATAKLESTLFYAPQDQQAQDLLRQVRQRLQEKLSKEHDSIQENHGTALESLGAIASPSTWDRLLFLSLCLCFCGFAHALSSPMSNLRTAILSLSWLLLALAIFAGVGRLGKSAVLSPGTPAILSQDASELLRNPDSRAEKTGVLVEGERVWITQNYADFVRLRRGDGSQGWTLSDAVEPIAVID